MTAPATLLASLSRRPATAEPDAELLGQFVTDADSAAFAELVHRYARLVWRVARTRCRTEATAEDVFQATFAVLHRKAKAIRTPSALAGWLHLTAHRLAIRATRRERPTVPLPPDLPHTADPLDSLTAREMLSAVDDELAKLNDSERAVLLLCGLDGVSNGEAAARLGISSGSVKGRLERARGKLRDRLSARGLTVPSVLVGLIGLAPPASALDVAVMLPAGGSLPPAVANLISETFAMNALNAKTVLTAAVAGLLLLVGGVMTDSGATPKADAAPVPREVKPLPKEVWGEAKGGLQAGLRMSGGAALELERPKEIHIIVRNVGKEERTVSYTEQQPGIGVIGDPRDGRFRLAYFANINGIPPQPTSRVLKPGEELVRWRATLVFSKPEADQPDDDPKQLTGIDKERKELVDLIAPPDIPVLRLAAGTHRVRMDSVGGDLLAERTKIGGLDALATGELEVRCVLPRPALPVAPRRNAPVPKAKAVLWSEPVKVDWKDSRAERIGGAWSPDGKSVLVPTPVPDAQDELLIRGGVDFRDAATGKVTKSLPFTGKAMHLFQPTAIRTDGTAVHAVGMLHEFRKKAEAASTLVTWPNIDAVDGRTMRATDGRWSGDIDLSPDGKRLVSVGEDGSVDLRETTAGRLFWTTKFGAKQGRATAAAVCGEYVAAATDTGGLIAIESSTGRQLGGFGGLGVKPRAVAASADGVLAVGGMADEKGTALVTLAGGPHTAKLIEPQVFADAVPAKERINGLSFSPDGKLLAAACSDGVLRVFDVATAKAVVEANEHKEEVFSVAYSLDGKKLLTVGKDAIKVWDVAKLLAK